MPESHLWITEYGDLTDGSSDHLVQQAPELLTHSGLGMGDELIVEVLDTAIV